jgi:hypothetical protein
MTSLTTKWGHMTESMRVENRFGYLLYYVLRTVTT